MVTNPNACGDPTTAQAIPEAASPDPTANAEPRAKNGWRVGKRGTTSAVNGAKNTKGPPRGRIEPELMLQAATAQVMSKATGAPLPDMPLSEWQLRVIKEISGLSPEQYRERIASKMEQVASMVLERLSHEVDRLDRRDLAITFGILNDHLMKTRGFGTPAIVNQTNIQINGVSRESALACISGGKVRAIKATEAVGNRFPPGLAAEQPAHVSTHSDTSLAASTTV